MVILRVFDDGQWKDIDESGFPCVVSVSSKGEPVFGDISVAPTAWVGLSNHQLFLQPGGASTPVMLNGKNISAQAWLSPGDAVTIGTTELRLRQKEGLFILSPDIGMAAERTPADATEDSTQSTRQNHAIPAFGPLPGKKTNHRLRNTVFAFFIVLLLAVVFVLTAVPVRITVTPQPDTVSLSRLPLSIKVWDRYLVVPGTYQLLAKKEGYRSLQESITVNFGADAAFTFTLNKLPGLLDVATKPIDGAEVSIDDVAIGTTPLTSIELEEGSHTISIKAQNYLPLVQTVEMQGMGIKQRINVELQPGKTIQEIELTTQNKETTIELISQPSGARVMLNGEFRGHTPLSLVVMPGTDHQLVLSKSGFATATRSVILEKSSESINVQLEPEYGIVFINCQPVDALLKVDGKILGAASRRLRLTTRPHRLEISKAGHETFKTTLTPLAGVSKKLEVQLKGTRSVAQAPVSSALTTAEGQVLHTIRVREPITFQMGASRRESGRRSNERLYQVEFTRTFSISEKEVTNAEFRNFQPSHTSGQVQGLDLNANNQPVTSVTWNDVAVYMNWLSKKEGLPPAYREKDGTMVAVVPLTTGYRLPTEAEWEFVARYAGSNRADGQPMKYPWGNERYPSNKNGNYADSSASGILPLTMKNYTDGFRAAAPVGTFPANAAKLYDLGGNISEWCHDYYDVYSGAPTTVLRNPNGPATGKYHVVRGASWRHGSIAELRLTYRDYTNKARDDLGFRIARYEKK